MFRANNTKFTKQNFSDSPKYLNFRISGQKLTPSKTIKYLGIVIDDQLSFKSHINEVSLKLCRANGMLAKIRHYVNLETLINIYHTIFASHLRYACQVWGQTKNSQLSKTIITK